MNLYLSLGIAATVFAALQWMLLPKIEAAWCAEKAASKIAKAGFIALLRSARTLAQFATVTLIIVVAVVSIAGLIGRSLSSGEYIQAISILDGIKTVMTAIRDNVIGHIGFWTALTGLAYLIYRRQKSELTDAFAHRLEAQLATLASLRERGLLQELPPTQHMTEIKEQIELRRDFVRQGNASISPEELNKIAASIDELEHVLTLLDIDRRLDFAEPAEKSSLVRRLWPKLVQLITSRGFARDTDFLSRVISNVGTIVLVLSMIGVTSSGVVRIVDDQVISLWDLQLEASKDEARHSWEAAQVSVTASEDTDAAEPAEETLDQLTAAFVDSYMSLPQWTEMNGLTETLKATERAVQSALLRERILVNHAGLASNSAKVAGGLLDADGRSREFARRLMFDPSADGSLEKIIKTKLKEGLGRTKATFASDLTSRTKAFAAAYKEPAGASSFLKAIAGEIINPMLDLTKVNVAGEPLNQAQALARKGLRASAMRTIDIMIDRYLHDLAGGSSVEKAAANLKVQKEAPGFLSSRDLKTALSYGFDRGGSIRSMEKLLNDNSVSLTHVQAKMDLATLDRLSQRKTWASAVASFEDYAPRHEKDLLATNKSQVLGRTDAKLGEKEIKSLVEASTDYKKLDLSKIVGGVLVGQPPANVQDLDNVELSWSIDKDGWLSIQVAVPGVTARTIGPMPVDVAYRALVFAADGRPLVVTILNTELFSQRKVILHPALVDSVTGCEMVSLDKFVFSHLDQTQLDRQDLAIERLRRFDTLYRYSQGLAVRHPFSTVDKDTLTIMWETNNWNSDWVAARLEGAVDDLQKGESPVLQHPTPPKYDQALVEDIQACADATDYAGCFKAHLIEIQEPRDVPEKIEVRSGVRDVKFSVDESLTMFTPSSQDAQWPLEFLIQDTTEKLDATYEFDSLKPGIKNSVEALQSADPIAAGIVQDAQNFVLAQRLFRGAFEGYIDGPSMLRSIDVLALELRQLTKDLHTTSPWDSSPQAGEVVLDQLEQLQTMASGDDLQRIGACRRWIESERARGALDAQGWSQHCEALDMATKIEQECDETDAACRLLTWYRDSAENAETASIIGLPINLPASKAPLASCRH